MCVCVCVSITLSVNSPTTGQTHQRIFTVDSLKDAYLRKDVPFGGLDDEQSHYGSKVPKKPIFGAWIGISSQIYDKFRLTWNLTGSCGQQQRLRGWSHMVVKQFQDGRRQPFWKSLYRYISTEKSSDFDEILYTAADFELDERHVIKNKKSYIGQTSSSIERISCFFWKLAQTRTPDLIPSWGGVLTPTDPRLGYDGSSWVVNRTNTSSLRHLRQTDLWRQRYSCLHIKGAQVQRHTDRGTKGHGTKGHRHKATRQKATETKGHGIKGHRTQRKDATELSTCARTTTSGFKNSGTNYTLCFSCACELLNDSNCRQVSPC